MGDIKDQIFGEVSDDMDFFKKIASKIPGFKGYIESQKMRDSDKLVRDYIFDRFRELEGRVSRLQRDFITQGQIGYIDDLEASAIKMRTFADRVRTAQRGYSGLFDAVKVNSEDLTKLYEYDAAMLTLADDVSNAIDNVEASVGSDGLPAAMRNLESKTIQCIEVFDRREMVISGTAG